MKNIQKIDQIGASSFLEKSKRIILTIGCEVLMTLSGKKHHAYTSAHTIKPQTQKCDFCDLPPGLRGLNILFLTDPHIGGNIDALATEVSTHIHTLLADAHPDKTLILHGGDFVCSEPGEAMITGDDFLSVSEHLFRGLSAYPQFGVVGNHDHENPHFPVIRSHLEELHAIRLLEEPEDVQRLTIGGEILAVHGIHTLSTFLHSHPKQQRDALLDRSLDALNAADIGCNCVLLHNPDGLEFLLQRLRETNTTLKKPTLFLAGHTHGAMFDVPLLRHLGLRTCRTQFGRYKGWYEPEGEYRDTGNWKLYVSTGMGNSPNMHYRLNADPEVVMMTL